MQDKIAPVIQLTPSLSIQDCTYNERNQEHEQVYTRGGGNKYIRYAASYCKSKYFLKSGFIIIVISKFISKYQKGSEFINFKTEFPQSKEQCIKYCHSCTCAIVSNLFISSVADTSAISAGCITAGGVTRNCI